MVMNEKEVRRYLNVIKRAVSFIEGMMDNNDGGLLEELVKTEPIPVVQPPVPVPVPVEPPVPVVSIHPPVEDNSAQIEQARIARKKHIGDLLKIDCWPEAVPGFLASKAPTDEDQVHRAAAVLDMMLEPNIEGKSFLDFGCGEGWIAQEALNRGIVESVGYDIKADPNWNKRKANFLADYDSIPKGHFDLVMLYDVLDHCEDPLDVMNKVRACMKPDGRVYVRCHPWTSRHGNHIWKQGMNRAYWHLFLCWEEIKDMIGQEPIFTRMEKNPLEAYRWWFHDFRIRKERPMNEPVSEFFRVPAFKELLANEQQIQISEVDEFLKRMETQFVDFVVSIE